MYNDEENDIPAEELQQLAQNINLFLSELDTLKTPKLSKIKKKYRKYFESLPICS